MSVNVGDLAPDFTATLSDGGRFRLSDFKGKVVVLYFYPRAMTAGCTREALRFNELLDEFTRLGAVVIGVSTDPPERNRRFAEKYQLRFRLASDPDGSVARLYGTLKSGAKRPTAARTTYVIDRDGRVAAVIRVRPAERHADEALKVVEGLA